IQFPSECHPLTQGKRDRNPQGSRLVKRGYGDAALTEFISLVIVAITIALPLSYFAADAWLQRFVFQTDLAWWPFISSGLIALLIARAHDLHPDLRCGRPQPSGPSQKRVWTVVGHQMAPDESVFDFVR